MRTGRPPAKPPKQDRWNWRGSAGVFHRPNILRHAIRFLVVSTSAPSDRSRRSTPECRLPGSPPAYILTASGTRRSSASGAPNGSAPQSRDRVDLAQPLRHIVLRNQLSADLRDLVLVRLAHIEHEHILAGVEALSSIPLRVICGIPFFTSCLPCSPGTMPQNCS